MDPILSLPFSEVMVINELERKFSKADGYSILIPSTRQQKGFDIVLFNRKTGKCASIQIKSSRTYSPKPPKRNQVTKFKNYTWFNRFRIDVGDANFYILFGLFITNPHAGVRSRSVKKSRWYDQVLLLFKEEEMIEFLKGIRLKRSDKPETKFGFGFNDKKSIQLTRGSINPQDLSDKLLDRRINIIKRFLD